MKNKKKPGPKLGSAKQAKQFFVSRAFGFPNLKFESESGACCHMINIPEEFALELLESIKAKKLKIV